MSGDQAQRHSLVLAGVMVLAVAAGVAVGGGALDPAAPPGGVDPLRGLVGVAGLLLALPLPGYAVMRAMFVGRLPEPVQQLALVVGLGLSLSLVGGFLLHATPIGMSRGSWAALLAGLTVLASLVALWRELRQPARTPMRSGTPMRAVTSVRSGTWMRAGTPWRGALRGTQARLLGAALLIVLAAFAVARVGAVEQPQPGFTQLWILPAEGSAVAVGVQNREGSDQRYTLRLSADGEALGPGRVIALGDGETFEARLPVPASLTATGSGATVQAVLERSGQTEPYRRVLLRLGDEAAPEGQP